MTTPGVPDWAVKILTDVGAVAADVRTLKGDVDGILDRERERLGQPRNGNRRALLARYGPWGGGAGVGVLLVLVERLTG